MALAKLESLEADVNACKTIKEAKNSLESLSFDFALLDLNLPDGESLDLLRESYIPSNTIVILMTGEGGISSAVEAIKLGASDYLSKPFDIDEIPLLFLKSDKARKNQRLIRVSLSTEFFSKRRKNYTV